MKDKQTTESILERLSALDELISKETATLKDLKAQRHCLIVILNNRKYYYEHKTQEPNSVVYKQFGKKVKDLTPTELREYNNLRAKHYRQRAKELESED